MGEIVSVDTAILAKEKGFDEITLSLYDCNGDIESPCGYHTGITKNSYLKKYEGDVCSAPTQSAIQKWLYENHNIIANFDVRIVDGKQIFKGIIVKIMLEAPFIERKIISRKNYSTPKMAMEYSLKTALNLLS